MFIAQSPGRPLVRIDEQLAAHTVAPIQSERDQSDLLFTSLLRLLSAAGAGV